MQAKVLIIAVVKMGEAILMRKKPAGSPPYDETWYIFGVEAKPDISPDDAVKAEVFAKSGVNVTVKNKISWENDLDGVEKFFIYLDVVCEYVDGELQPGEGIEKLEWVLPQDLGKYDIVPPSKVLFKKLGYIE